MSGSKIGGLKAAQKNKELYGEDYYKRIGAKGGRISTGGGFGNGEAGKALARRAGAIGGRISRRTKVVS